MTNKCIPLYKPTNNRSTTFSGRRQSSTLIISLYSSCRHKENCRTTSIKCGPHTCNGFISTSNIRQGAPIMSLTASVDLPCLHSPSCSIHVGMTHLSGPNFINKMQTSPPPISSWVHAWLSPIFTFTMNSYAIWTIFVFLQVSVQRWFGKPTTVGWKKILAWIKL